jgi:hypothetical protein
MHHATLTRRPARPARPGRAVAAVLIALAMAACQPAAGGGEGITDGLLILAKGESPTLEVLVARGDAESTVQVEIPLPGTNASWISAGGAGSLAATTADGRLFVSDPVDPGGPAAALAGLGWRRADATGGTAAFEGPGWFATWDPSGRAFAALAGDLLDGGDMRLVVIDTASPKPVEIALGRPLLPGPPAWLDADRVAVVGGTTAAPETVVVEIATGEATRGPDGERRIATSGDGKIVATSAGAGAPVVIRSTRAWLAEDGTSVGTIEVPDGSTEAIAMALDVAGERLAIVWVGSGGTPRYDVHDGTDGWRRVMTAELPGAAAAALAWLR